VKRGFIERRYLYTVRKGEVAWDNMQERMVVIQEEMVKVKERGKDSGSCIFYEDEKKACAIYPSRPAQCSALKCWDTADFTRVFQEPKVKRGDLIEDGVTLGLIDAHEKRCSYAALGRLVKEIPSRGSEPIEKILEMLRFDYELRPFASEKVGLRMDETDLWFGRPLVETIPMYGLKVIRQPDGGFFLTVNK
jgi:hypothetical protein